MTSTLVAPETQEPPSPREESQRHTVATIARRAWHAITRRKRRPGAAGLRRLLGAFRERCLDIARDVAATAHSIERSLGIAQEQARLAESVLAAGTQSCAALEDTNGSIQTIAAACEASVQRSRTSVDELQLVLYRAEHAGSQVRDFAATVKELEQRSNQVRESVHAVGEIARQTRLLALNASLEAARAGDMGRGFGVVATEVRELSSRVQDAAAGIVQIVEQTLVLVRRTATAAASMGVDIGEVASGVGAATARCAAVLQDMESVNAGTSRLAATVEQLSAANASILDHMNGSFRMSMEVQRSLGSTKQASVHLFETTEAIQESLSELQLDDGVLERRIGLCRQWAGTVQRGLERLASAGHDLFDKSYRPIPRTNPPQVMVAYQPAFEAEIRPLLDAARDALDAQACACIASDCYTPTHNTAFSRPPTGDPSIDIVHCRDKRLMTEGAQGRRSATHKGSMLLQTYVRDNGQLACEIAIALAVHGRRWGALRVAFDPAALQS